MKTSFLVSLSYLFASVWAGGYQGCLERVWLYNALLIDISLNDEASRTIGMSCKGKDWDRVLKTCSKWQPLKGTRGEPPTYDQFIASLGNSPGGKDWAVFQDGDTKKPLDIIETAKRTYVRYTTPKPGQDASKATVKNYAAQLVVKDTWEFNQMIARVGEVIDTAYKSPPSGGFSDKQNALFEAFDESLDHINKARAGDHGRYLIEEARSNARLSGIDIKTMSMGDNPFPGSPPRVWDTVDWAETEKVAIANGVPDASTKINDFKTFYYGPTGSTSAREHLVVMQSFKHVVDQKVACGRP